MYVVTWGNGEAATLEDDGEVIKATDRRALNRVLGRTVVEMLEGDSERILEPGQDGHVPAALRQLPGATVTGP
jgi:hypothetical protein